MMSTASRRVSEASRCERAHLTLDPGGAQVDVAPLHAVGLRRVVLLEQPKERGARALLEPAVSLCGAMVTVAFLKEGKVDQDRALAQSHRVKGAVLARALCSIF
jgi:hypothetical protein